jgi:murein DD-endopeptidase MepM/ murein hydrolase activator NlpD
MRKLTINLPNHRLDLKVTKRRETTIEKPLTPSLSQIKNIKSGSKVSRFFRHIFENKRIQKILGTNIALMVLATSFMPNNTLAETTESSSIIAEASINVSTEKGVQYPVGKISITQGYKLFHPGIDLDGITGDPIKPIKAGFVEAISRSKYAYGNAIIINHGNQLTSLYAHLSKILVIEGQEVTINTVIGEMGATGRAFGDHLHMEIRDHGTPINPTSVLSYPKI